MAKVEVSQTIKMPREQLYKLIQDMENFPKFMRDVKSLKIIKRIGEDRIVTMWEVEIDGEPVNWKEEDYFDAANYQIKFNMLEGDYKEYQGYWMIQDAHHDSRVTLRADFDWGMPILEKYVGKVLENKARRGLLGMIQAIKSQAEKPK